MQWWELWHAWFQGDQVQTASLWGLPVLVWGRLGKALEFLAGLVVVVDLLDPDKLRRRGALARQRLDARRQRSVAGSRMFVLDNMHGQVVGTLIRGEHTGEGDTVFEVNHASPAPPGPYAPYTAAEYEQLRTATLAGLATAHECHRPHGDMVCPAQVAFVGQQVHDFLYGYWSDEDRQLIGEARKARDRGAFVWLCVLVAVVALCLVLRAPLLVTGLVATVATALFSLSVISDGWRLSAPGLWVRAHPAAMAGSLLAGLLDKARPLHVLRKIAVVLFVIGFHFDLLAS